MSHLPKLKIQLFLSILSILLVLCTSVTAANSAADSAPTSYVKDDASILTEDEISDLNAQIMKFYEKHNYPIYLYTITDNTGLSNSVFLSNQADALSINDGILVLINMNDAEREIIIQSYGSIQDEYMTGERLQKVNDSMVDSFKNQKYKKGFDVCLSMLNKYSNSKADLDSPIYLSWVQLLFAMAVALVVLCIMIINSKGRITTSQMTYLNAGASRVIGRHDHYIRTSYVRTKRETDSNSGGGSGGSSGVSGGGRSFTQSSNKF